MPSYVEQKMKVDDGESNDYLNVIVTKQLLKATFTDSSKETHPD